MKKFVIGLVMVFGVMLALNYAYGQQQPPCTIPNWTVNGCPDWSCPRGYLEYPPDSCYPVTLDEMVYSAGDQFEYRQLYLDQMASWGSNNASRFREAWRPVKEVVFSSISPPRLQTFFRADSSQGTRVTFDQPQRAELYPEVYRWKKSGGHLAFVASFTSDLIPGSEGWCPSSTTNPSGQCQYPAFNKKNSLGSVDIEEIESIYWEGKTNSDTPGLIVMNEMNVAYDNTQPPYASTNFSQIRLQYNFWNSPIAPQAPDVSRIMAWWHGIIPDQNQVTNILVRISGKDHTLTFAGGNILDIPPIVPLKSIITGEKTNVEKGKVKDKIISVTVENLLVSEDASGNLVIQWLGPTVSTSYMQLSVFVGEPWQTETIPESIWYAWISAPPQSSTVVLPKASWEAVKTALPANHRAQVQIHYGHRYFRSSYGNKSTPMGTYFDIRGVSEIVEIPY